MPLPEMYSIYWINEKLDFIFGLDLMSLILLTNVECMCLQMHARQRAYVPPHSMFMPPCRFPP